MMSPMPTARIGDEPKTQGPVEQLLIYTREILELQSLLSTARLLRRLMRLSIFIVAAGALSLYAINIIEWHKMNLKLINWPMALIIALALVYIITYFVGKHDAATDRSKGKTKSIFNVPKLELELELVQERRRLHAVSLDLGIQTRQIIYRDSVPIEIDRYRTEGKYYRRVHNSLQAVVTAAHDLVRDGDIVTRRRVPDRLHSASVHRAAPLHQSSHPQAHSEVGAQAPHRRHHRAPACRHNRGSIRKTHYDARQRHRLRYQRTSVAAWFWSSLAL
jgi:hypothetical protein